MSDIIPLVQCSDDGAYSVNPAALEWLR